jgi:hypothetical protein
VNIIERIKSDREHSLNIINAIIKAISVADNECLLDCDCDDAVELMSNVLENEKSLQSGVLLTPYGMFRSIESLESYLKEYEPDKLDEDVDCSDD